MQNTDPSPSTDRSVAACPDVYPFMPASLHEVVVDYVEEMLWIEVVGYMLVQ
jgi:hypothetical protein